MRDFANDASKAFYSLFHGHTEESEFSSFIFRSPSISFLTLPYALIDVPLDFNLPNTAKFCSLHGVFTMQLPIAREELPPPFPNFPVLSIPISDVGSLTPKLFMDDDNQTASASPVELIEGTIPGRGVWFPDEWATRYEIDWTKGREHLSSRYIGRGGPFVGGTQGVWEHVEPRKPTVVAHATHDPTVEVALYEGLYAHFFNEKYDACEL